MFYLLGEIKSAGSCKYYLYRSQGKDRGFYTCRSGYLAEGPLPEKYMRQTIIMDAHGDPKVYLPLLEQVASISSALSESYA